MSTPAPLDALGTAASTTPQSRGVFVRMFSSAVASQVLLSGASFVVGLWLIRHTTETQYGWYVLVTTAILLLSSLQSAFFGPAMVIRMTPLDRKGRGDLVGGLYREQRRLLTPITWFAVAVVFVLLFTDLINNARAMLLLAGVGATAAVLKREYLRTALYAYRRSDDVLRGDVCFVLLLIGGVLLATLTPYPAAAAAATMAVAAFIAGGMLSAALKRNEPWNDLGAPGILQQIASGAGWATSGAGIHWTFSQGYTYVVAATLDVTAVAAIAATRLLLMPINLLSTGISSLMLPVTSTWLRDNGARTVFGRLLTLAVAIGFAAALYLAVMWLARDWIFANVLRKQFEHSDELLLLWAAISLVMVVRDQLRYLPVARARFRQLTELTALSAVLSLVATYWGMVHYAEPGALFGVLTGELISVAGIIALSWREMREPAGASGTTQATPDVCNRTDAVQSQGEARVMRARS